MTKHGKDPQSKHNKGFLFGGDQRNQKKPTPHPLSKQGRAAASANAQIKLKPIQSAPWPGQQEDDGSSDDNDNVDSAAPSQRRLRRLDVACIPSKGLPPNLHHLCQVIHPDDPHSSQSCAARAAFLRVPASALHPAAEAESDPASNYDLALEGPSGERLAIDATHAGSIARFCNDYRNILNRPNAELRDFIARPAPMSGTRDLAFTKAQLRGASPLEDEAIASRGSKAGAVKALGTEKGSSHSPAPPEEESSISETSNLAVDEALANLSVSDVKPARPAVGAQTRPIIGLAIYSASKPIKRGEEICISYGKGFWAAREGRE
ncbi:hypothetical protein CBOM_01374 [Ceraceosorus bombacis]|uniref:SET domain-containing protein n=1 Tax=Ceraceosorus bombacis TaxID=401625 RepID=A0A0P1BDT1_9BASI|nr:hypothetical protein CBOM_01374 [Ceraceosorus bombacis]